MRPNFQFLSAALNRHPKAWWSAEVEEAVSERRKGFALAHRSDEDRQAASPLPDVLRQSLPKSKLKRHGRRPAFLSRPNLTLNLCTFSFALSLALLPHLLSLLTFPTVPLSGNRLRSTPITSDPTFLTLRQMP